MPESAIALHVTGTDCDSNGRFQAVFRLGPRPVMNSLTRIPTDELIGTKGLWITHGLGSRTAGVSVKDNAQDILHLLFKAAQITGVLQNQTGLRESIRLM